MPEKVVIVGAGLAGSLLAILMGKRGFKVDVFEKRQDMRKVKISAGKSINLALSNRGIAGLKEVDMVNEMMKEAVPMYGRLTHSINGETVLHPYSGREGEYINSVSRGGLNMSLMNKAEEYDNVNIHFNMNCTGMNFETGETRFNNATTGEEKVISADVTFGTDGANSAIRDDMFNRGVPRFNFSRSLLDHGYKELLIPPAKGGGFRMDKNALHIWPRGTYMLIALPNYEGSFTVTLFLPFEGKYGFDNLDTEEKVMAFFREQFPDAIENMPALSENFFENPANSLATIKCYPWQVNGRSLLIGDAAHAVVPFYGQGMNCSFEDCIELNKFIDKYGTDWKKVFAEYEQSRKINTDAIADLAEENFFEMRDHVADPVFIKKREIELILEKKYPDYFSKYSLVTFQDHIPYHDAMVIGRKQDAILMEVCTEVNSVDQLNLDEVYSKLKSP